MKKILVGLLVGLMLLSFSACEKNILHCDAQGCEATVNGDKNMTEDWIIYCGACSETLFDE